MRIVVIPNFATAEEISELNTWAELAAKYGWLSPGITYNGERYYKRLTSRLHPDRYTYPITAFRLSSRIRKFVGVDDYPLIEGHGRDGIVISYTMVGGDVYKHKDPKGMQNLATLRCNILTQKDSYGGELYVDGEHINVGIGDLHCYLVSEHEHWVTVNKSDTPRIMWMFGAHVPAKDWDSKAIGAHL